MTTLTQKKCKPCEGIGSPLDVNEVSEYLKQVKNWTLKDDKKSITKNWKFKNFVKAIEFVNSVATIAEAENHHPDIRIYSYRNVSLTLSTHALKGLTENDFIVAAKLDLLVV